MRLHSFAHVGTDPFQEPVEIDFDQLPDIVVACGPVGSGKTTTLDLIAASMHLTMPFRAGAIHSNFTKAGYVRTQVDTDTDKRDQRVLGVVVGDCPGV